MFKKFVLIIAIFAGSPAWANLNKCVMVINGSAGAIGQSLQGGNATLKLKAVVEALGQERFTQIMSQLTPEELQQAAQDLRLSVFLNRPMNRNISNASKQFLISLAEFDRAFPGTLHGESGYHSTLAFLEKMSDVSSFSSEASTASTEISSALPEAAKFLSITDWFKVELLKRALSEHGGHFPGNSPEGIGVLRKAPGDLEKSWRAFSLWMAPHKSRAGRIISFLEEMQEIAQRHQWVDELATLNLNPENAVGFLYDSPARLDELANTVLTVFLGPKGEEQAYTMDDLQILGATDINLWAVDKRAKRVSQSKILAENDAALVSDLERLVEFESRELGRVWKPSDQSTKSLKIETAARERTLPRVRSRYYGYTSIDTGARYTYQNYHHEAVYKTVTDSKGRTSRVFSHYKKVVTSHTAYLDVEDILTDSYPTGNESTPWSKINALKAEARIIKAKENPQRAFVSGVESQITSFFNSYTEALAAGTHHDLISGWGEVAVAIDQVLVQLNEYIKLADGSGELVIAQYSRDTLNGFRGRQLTNIARLENAKRLMQVLTPLVERGVPNLRPEFFFMPIDLPMEQLTEIDNSILGQKVALTGATALTGFLGFAPETWLPNFIVVARESIAAEVMSWFGNGAR